MIRIKMKATPLLAIVITLVSIVVYVTNAYKFTKCDFEPNYKCEAIHGVGLIPSPLSVITVWFNTDEQ